MSKLIVEMEMPQACPCEFADSSSGIFTPCFAYYGVVERAAEFDKCARSGRRPEWCPIKGVLPEEHGDLIDRSALWELMCTYDDYQGAKGSHDLELIHRDSILFAIETAPTVIAAERSEHGTTAD